MTCSSATRYLRLALCGAIFNSVFKNWYLRFYLLHFCHFGVILFTTKFSTLNWFAIFLILCFNFITFECYVNILHIASKLSLTALWQASRGKTQVDLVTLVVHPAWNCDYLWLVLLPPPQLILQYLTMCNIKLCPDLPRC